MEIILKGSHKSMNIKSAIKRICVEACVVFTCITALFALITWAINLGEGQVLLDASRVLLFFVFSVLFAAANGIFRIKQLSGGIRLVSHLALCTLAFYLCFILPLNMPGTTAMVGMILFVIIYFILAAIIAFFASRFRKNKEEHSEYDRKFKKTAKR